MSQGQPFIWKSSLGGPISWVGWSLWGISKVGQTVWATVWLSLRYGTSFWLCGSVGRGFRKGTMAHLSVWEKAVLQFSFWCQTLPFLSVCHWYLSSCYLGEGAQRKWVWLNLSVDSSRETAWDSRSFFHLLNSCWFLQPEVMGGYVPGTRTGLVELVWGWDSSLPRHSSWIFIHHTRGTSPFCVSAPPTSLDGCGFFNSIVVRLPFNSFSDGSEWWLFYILVVILMGLCEEVNHVSLCCHLDQAWISETDGVLRCICGHRTKWSK